MDVQLLEATRNPEEVVCRTARGDYSAESVGPDRAFADVMATVDGDDLQAKTETLIDHLMRSGHYGPFEHPTATFAVEGVSRACMAQLTRHRHASFDVMSMRYVDLSGADPTERFTYPDSFTDEEVVSREGVDEVTMPAEERTEIADDVYEHCKAAYEELVDAGVPKEDARMLLPIGTQVNLTFSMNARAVMHFLDMRLKADAQWEIRELSRRVLDHCQEWMPYTFEQYAEKHPNELTP
jgi:thymidylate synthase (FAD)